VDVYHGERRVDDYFWLRERTNPAVREYLEKENAYTQAVTARLAGVRETLYQELLSHIKETDMGVPYREGEYFYYSRTEKGKQYPIHCRKKGSLDAAEEIVIDENEMAKGEKFFDIDAFEVSRAGDLLAFTVDVVGYREYTLRVKNLRTGELLAERIPKVTSVAWAADGQTLFYVVEDHAKRPYRLYRHKLGRPSSEDELLYEEKDERFRLEVSLSRSREYLFLVSESQTTTEVRFLRANEPNAPWKLVEPRVPEHQYSVDHHGTHFYIRSNKPGRNFALFRTPVLSPGSHAWKVVVPHRSDVMLEGVELFARHAVLLERKEALPRLRILEIGTGSTHEVTFPEPTYVVWPEHNHEFNTTKFRYSYESLVTPKSIFDYDMTTRQATLLKQVEVPGGFDRSNYVSEFIWAPAQDGVRVPVSLVYRKGLRRDGSRPMLLVGYGAYGFPLAPRFRVRFLPLLDRNVVVALAHVRGGGEKGKPWHDDGRMMKKRNTFTDFIAVAEYLVAQGYAARDRVAIEGASAGGLLMGAVVNMRPDLFRVVLMHVPFVDVINTMMDPSLPLTVTEYEEWGNPNKKEEYDYIRSYCPYSNLRRGAYPAMLVTTAWSDSQVMYWEPAKYVAKMRTLKTDTNPLLLHTVMEGGHGGPSGRYDSLREDAFNSAFLLWQLGLVP